MVRAQGMIPLTMHLSELVAVFGEGQSHCHISAMQLEIASFRWHLIMSVVIECTDLQTQALTRWKLSFINFAGSEHNKKSGMAREKLKEAQAINKSLSAPSVQAESQQTSHYTLLS